MKFEKIGQIFMLTLALSVLAFVVGCGDSDEFVVTNNNTGNSLQVQFSRANVLAQQTEFAAADEYIVSVVDGNLQQVVPGTRVAANLNLDTQTIVVTGIPDGTFTVILSALSNGVVTSQVSNANVAFGANGTAAVGQGTGAALTAFAGNFDPLAGTTTTTGGTTTGGYTGGYTTGGYTGGYTTGGYTGGGYNPNP